MQQQTPQDRLHVLVLFGGRSGEHEVSLASARSVVAHLDPAKYQVTLMGITKDGQWVFPADAQKALADGFEGVATSAARVLPDHGANMLAACECSGDACPPVDVVFPVLHGTNGEDGTVQGLLDLAGVAYVGSGVLGSAVGMDKVIMSRLFMAAGLTTPAFVDFRRSDWRGDPAGVTRLIEEQIGYPCYVKPVNMGSSVGISKVKSPEQLAPAIDLAVEFDLKVIVEKSIENAHEVECSVLGNDAPEASVVGEIIPSREFYSYEAKYVDGSSEAIIPAPLPEDVAESIRRDSVAAFKALDLSGLARVDFLVKRDTHEVYISEVNTLPGFTKISMYPKLWEASGLSYPALLDRLIQLGIQRHAERESLRTSYT